MSLIKNSLFDIFYLDTRSLAIFRIGLGAVILCNVYTYLPFVDAFFGPHSVYPLSLYYQNPNFISWSIHALHNHPFFIYGLFIIEAVLALMFMLGFHTRLTGFLSWVLAVSLHHRIYMATFGGDAMMTSFLLWGTLLPLGASWSMDARLQKYKNIPQKFISIAATGFILQMVIIYFVTGFAKTHETWVKDYTAIYYVLKTFEFAKPFGTWLTQFPDVLMVLTFLTVVLERYATFLLFMPFRAAFFRLLLIASFTIFHVMIFVTMDVGWFPWIMIVLWTALIPSDFWNWVQGKKGSSATARYLKAPVTEIIAVALIIQILVWNFYFFENKVNKKKLRLPAPLRFSYLLNLDSKFIFFVPKPPLTTHRFYFKPVFENIDDARVEKEGFSKQYSFKEAGHYRWVKLLGNLQRPNNKKYVPYLEQYMVHYWNQKYPKGPKVKGAEVLFVEDKIITTGNGYATQTLSQL